MKKYHIKIVGTDKRIQRTIGGTAIVQYNIRIFLMKFLNYGGEKCFYLHIAVKTDFESALVSLIQESRSLPFILEHM